MTESVEVGAKAKVAPRDRATSGHIEAPGATRAGYGARRVFLAALLLLSGGLTYGVWRHYEQNSIAAESARQRRDFVPRVRVGKVKNSSPVMRISLPASIDAFESANIYSRASGYIAKRYVDIGSRVKVGQKLVDITAPELEDQIKQAEAALSQAEASLRQTDANRELARVTNSRTSVLAKQGWATKQQGDVDRLNFLAQQNAAQAATANVETQKAQIRLLRQKRSYLEVLAPFDGVVTQRNVDVGSLVQADLNSGTFMFQMMRGNVVRVQTYVPQDQAFGLKAGVEAIIRVPEIPGREFPGTVTRVADALQPATRTLQTEVDVQNPDGALVPGAYCTVELLAPRKTRSLVLPSGAIIFNQHGVYVAVVKDGVAHFQQVTIVHDLGKEVEVNSGVVEGDEVILSPPVDLTDGQAVEIRAAETASTH